MKRHIIIAIFILAHWTCSHVLRGDVITLKNGEKLTGKIAGRTHLNVVVEYEPRKFRTIPLTEIEKIEEGAPEPGRPPAPEARVDKPPEPPPFDASAFAKDTAEVNKLIDAFDLATARVRLDRLRETYPEQVKLKAENVQLVEKLLQRVCADVSAGKIKIPMSDFAKRYSYAGDVTDVGSKGITGQKGDFKLEKKWADFTKQEICTLLEKCVEANDTGENRLGLAAFLMEGSTTEDLLKLAEDNLDMAAGKGADSQDARLALALCKNTFSPEKLLAEALKGRLELENQAIVDQLLLYEPFDDNKNNWPITPSGDAARYIKDGAYVLVDEREKYYTCAMLERSFTDFVFQVKMSCEGDEKGTGTVRFRRADRSFLEFALRFSRFCEFLGSDWRQIGERRCYDYLSPDILKLGAEATNVIEGRCVGDRIKCWCNRKPTAEVVTDLPASGRFEFVSSCGARFTTRYDDLIVFSVKKNALPPYVSTLPEPVAPELRKLMGVPLCIKTWDHEQSRVLCERVEGKVSERSIHSGQFVVDCVGTGTAINTQTSRFGDCMVSVKAKCMRPPREKRWGYGILVRQPAGQEGYEGKGYRLAITEEGGQVVFLPPKGGNRVLAKGIAAQGIRATAPNELGVLCRGKQLKFYINGTPICEAVVSDDKFLRGNVMTLVWGKDSKVAFDDLVVYSIKPQ